jgi:hypothetical protein
VRRLAAIIFCVALCSSWQIRLKPDPTRATEQAAGILRLKPDPTRALSPPADAHVADADVGSGFSRSIRATTLHAQQPDPWGFEEEEAETWRDIYGPQIADVALTASFLAFAMVSFFRKSVTLKYATPCLPYMGFY